MTPKFGYGGPWLYRTGTLQMWTDGQTHTRIGATFVYNNAAQLTKRRKYFLFRKIYRNSRLLLPVQPKYELLVQHFTSM